jgi:hypothetical protein
MTQPEDFTYIGQIGRLSFIPVLLVDLLFAVMFWRSIVDRTALPVVVYACGLGISPLVWKVNRHHPQIQVTGNQIALRKQYRQAATTASLDGLNSIRAIDGEVLFQDSTGSTILSSPKSGWTKKDIHRIAQLLNVDVTS